MNNSALKLTQDEKKIIGLIEFHADLNDPKQKEKICKAVSKKDYFSSERGLLYKRYVLEYTESGYSPIDCAFCMSSLESEELFICNNCKSKLRHELQNKANNRTTKNLNNNHLFIGIIIGIVVTTLLLSVLYCILHKNSNKKIETKIDGSDIKNMTLVENNSVDLSIYLGHDYSLVEKLLGDSVPIISDNTRYFEESGISVVYDTDNNTVIYLDQDGSGLDDKTYEMYGLHYGMDANQVYDCLTNMGFDMSDESPETVGDGDVWAVYIETDEYYIELSSEFDNGVASVITLKTVN